MSSEALEPVPPPLAAGAGDRPAAPPPAAPETGSRRASAAWHRVAARARGFLGRASGLNTAAFSGSGRPRRLWDRVSARAQASLGPSSTAQATPALPSAPAIQAEPETPRRRAERVKKTSRELRWERRRRRRFSEEVLGWILVPVILLSCYWAVKSGLTALGTTPTALIQGIKAAASGKV